MACLGSSHLDVSFGTRKSSMNQMKMTKYYLGVVILILNSLTCITIVSGQGSTVTSPKGKYFKKIDVSVTSFTKDSSTLLSTANHLK